MSQASRFLILIFSVILLGCENRSWAEQIQTKVNAYNQNATEINEYSLKSGSSVIFVTEFSEQDGLKKIRARHLRDAFLNFERHIFTENDVIVYTHYIGLAPHLGGDDSSNFLIFNEQTFWENKSVGLKLSQNAPSEEFVEQEVALEILDSTPIKERALNAADYNKIYGYLEELMSSKPKE